jgi:hypothetical protein
MAMYPQGRNAKQYSRKKTKKKEKKEKKKQKVETATCRELLLVKAALVLGVHFSLDKMASGKIADIFLFKN